ncbi:MAG: hypothetical protein AAFN77_17930 [Planctomycetota bacterium]
MCQPINAFRKNKTANQTHNDGMEATNSVTEVASPKQTDSTESRCRNGGTCKNCQAVRLKSAKQAKQPMTRVGSWRGLFRRSGDF